MRRLLGLLLALAGVLAITATASALPSTRTAAQPAAPATDRGPVLVVGVPGLQWADVGPATPALRRLLDDGAAGVLSVKAVPAVSCRADGWLTLGAGNRAVAPGVRRSPCGADLPVDARAVVAANEQERQGAEPGALAAALDGCVDVRGAGPELAVLGEPLAGAVDGQGCGLVLREAPPVRGTGTERVASVVAADRVLAGLVSGGDARHVLVVGLAAGPGQDAAALGVAVAAGPAFPPGALTSASTRRAPYVQLVDVAPTVLDLLDGPVPASMTGQPWRSVGERPSVDALADLALLAQVQKAATVPFFVGLLGAQLALLVLLWRRRPELAELVALGGTAALGASYLAGLVPWWRSPAPLLTLLAVVGVLASAVAALALRQGRPSPAGRRRDAAPAHAPRERALLRPVGAACAFPATVLLVDLVTGAHLQISSVAGYSPLVAGRFAGIGNVAFGVLAGSVLLATAALTRRASAVAAVGVVAVAVDGAPAWGSDVGGVLALVPAFVLLGLQLSGRRVSALRLAAAFAAGAAVVTAFALLDLRRGEQDRTHLGRFAQDLVDGTAGTLLRRKAEAVLGLLLSSPVTAALPLVLAAAVYVVLRPPPPLRAAFASAPAWRAGLVATGLAGALGFAVNDSGAAVPALALCVALPATAAVVLRVRRSAAAGAGSVERAAARRGAARC